MQNQMDTSLLQRRQPNWKHQQNVHADVINSANYVPDHPESSSHVSCSNKKRKAEFDVEEDAGEEQSEITTKIERETSTITCSKVEKQLDYIHVRARRGQATDSHSLAERARREKISKKMKFLQDLVPSCNKVTGKAGVLDEIINYVQSLQKQVEFLSTKLAASNPRLEFSISDFFAKEIPPYISSLPESSSSASAQLEATHSTYFQYHPMQAMDQPQRVGTSFMPIPEGFLDSSCVLPHSGWDSDWPNLYNAGFHY